MPMTPWHVGPGLALKALAGPRMSLAAFVTAQAVTDVEVVVRLLTRQEWVHGPTHTILGGVAVAALVAAATVPTARSVAWLFGRPASGAAAWAACRWKSAAWGALAGTMSHVVLDSIMHPDAYPFWPLSTWNPLLKLLNNVQLHDFCFWTGAFGAVAWAVITGYRRWKTRPALETA